MWYVPDYGIGTAGNNRNATIIFKFNYMKKQINTLPYLRVMKWIKLSDISKVVARQTYYNWINWKIKPTNKETIEKFCQLFEIDNATFYKLLKNTIKNV